MQPKPETMPNADRGWWESPWVVALVLAAMTLPLLWPSVPPLTDLPGHMGRYKIASGLNGSASLRTFFDYRWSLIPNLGVDLLVVPLAKLIGLEAATKLIVVAIPPLTVAGFIWVAKEAHGRLPSSYLVAAPLAYGYPFLFGFVNYSLAAGLAFLAAGLWARLGREGRLRLRALVFVPIALAIWIAHAFGWGLLGLLAFSFELWRQRERAGSLAKALLPAIVQCLPLALPLVLAIVWQSGVRSPAGDWFNVPWKVSALMSVFRDRWIWIDLASVTIVIVLLFVAARDPRTRFAWPLVAAAGLIFCVFALIPGRLLGGAHTDDRLVPYMLAVALLAISPDEAAPRRFVDGLAMLGLGFFAARMTVATASAWSYGRSFDRELQALDSLPAGARMVAFVGVKCEPNWTRSRLEHLPSMAIVRREAFANDQWTVPGSHLLKVKAPWSFYVDPSQMVATKSCKEVTPEREIARIPPGLFDYVWLIDPPRYDERLTRSWIPVWRSGPSVLFRLPKPAVPAAAQTAKATNS